MPVIKQKVRGNGLSEYIATLQHEVRKPLPFEDETFDAYYSHILYCMPLTISKLKSVSNEKRDQKSP
ncbi:MAG: hypothetical protein AB9861_20020 [Methanosarcina sp.]